MLKYEDRPVAFNIYIFFMNAHDYIAIVLDMFK